MYMLPTSSSMRHLPPWYGVITAPARWGIKPIREGRAWCMDNGVFTGRFAPDAFLAALKRFQPHARTCHFVAAPDVVGDAVATLERWNEWASAIHAYGFPAAIVAQDGMHPNDIPSDADAVFIGGSTDFKLGPNAEAILEEANKRGLWTHVGRVNSNQRIRRFQLQDVDSVDGTYSAFAGVDKAVQHFNQALGETPLVGAS